MLSILIIALLSYVLGSIPWSIILSRIVKGIDIRNYGSGNAGATNVFRVLGWKLGIIVLILDILKGFIATRYLSQIQIDPVPLHYQSLQILAGAMAIAGHIWTIFAGFKGGKGVGAGAGMLLGLNPVAALSCICIFIIVLLITRIVSISSMIAAISFPLILVLIKNCTNQLVTSPLIYFSAILALLIIFTHRTNIKRLINGKENRISLTKK